MKYEVPYNALSITVTFLLLPLFRSAAICLNKYGYHGKVLLTFLITACHWEMVFLWALVKMSQDFFFVAAANTFHTASPEQKISLPSIIIILPI